MTTPISGYPTFEDTAREALEFYRSVFGGELLMTTFADHQVSEDPTE